MKIALLTITFAVTIGGLLLFENYKTPAPEQDYAKIVNKLRQTSTPSFRPTKSPLKNSQSIKQPAATSRATPSPTPTPTSTPSTGSRQASSPQATPTPAIHVYYTSSSTSAKYYYCDTDSGWKNLSKANLKQFSSLEELLKSYPTRTLHELCK